MHSRKKRQRWSCCIIFRRYHTFINERGHLWGNRWKTHDGVMILKGSPHYWPFVRGIHRSSVDSPHKGPVMRSFDVPYEVSQNKLPNNQSRGTWIDVFTSIVRQCNVVRNGNETETKILNSNSNYYHHCYYNNNNNNSNSKANVLLREKYMMTLMAIVAFIDKLPA